MRYPSDSSSNFILDLFKNEPVTFPLPLRKTEEYKQLLNPGSLKNIHSKALSIMPIWIDGAQLSSGMSYGITKNIFCSWILSHVEPTGFRIGGSYRKQIKDNLLVRFSVISSKKL